jgi:hypothetical protein
MITLLEKTYHGFEDFFDYFRDMQEICDFGPGKDVLKGEFQGQVKVLVTYEKDSEDAVTGESSQDVAGVGSASPRTSMEEEARPVTASKGIVNIPALIQKLRKLRVIEAAAQLAYYDTVALGSKVKGPRWVEPLRQALTRSCVNRIEAAPRTEDGVAVLRAHGYCGYRNDHLLPAHVEGWYACLSPLGHDNDVHEKL